MIIEPIISPVFAVVIISALVFGMFGFGYTLLVVAFLPFFISVKVAVPMTAIQIPFSIGIMLYSLRRHLTIRPALPLIVGLILGLPIGVHLLRILSEGTVRKFLGVMILIHCLWSFRKASAAMPILRSDAWGLLAGLLSGIVGGAILAAGPIVMAYLSMRGFTKEKMKGTFLLWAMTMALVIIPIYALSGLLTAQVLHWGLITMPFVGLGIFFGVRIFDRLEQRFFYRLILILLMATGMYLLFS
jgi:uncharacterized membrane protein YfcA